MCSWIDSICRILSLAPLKFTVHCISKFLLNISESLLVHHLKHTRCSENQLGSHQQLQLQTTNSSCQIPLLMPNYQFFTQLLLKCHICSFGGTHCEKLVLYSLVFANSYNRLNFLLKCCMYIGLP